MNNRKKPTVERISLSIPAPLVQLLDQKVADRGFSSRSQAVSEMLHQNLTEEMVVKDEQIMTGTITLIYEPLRRNLSKSLSEIKYQFIAEVISSFHVLLENDHAMEVILVQGKASHLRDIADKLIACKGIKTGKLEMFSLILPPIQSREKIAMKN